MTAAKAVELIEQHKDEPFWLGVGFVRPHVPFVAPKSYYQPFLPYDRMVYITGSDVKNKKPDPELFVTAAQRLGLDPRVCVVIEDAPNGVEAAHAAGAKCIAVTNSTTREKLSEADLVVSDMTSVSIQTVRKLVDNG